MSVTVLDGQHDADVLRVDTADTTATAAAAATTTRRRVTALPMVVRVVRRRRRFSAVRATGVRL